MITQYNVKESENLFAPTHHRHMLTTKDYILYYTTDSFHAFCETFEFPAVFASLSRFMTTDDQATSAWLCCFGSGGGAAGRRSVSEREERGEDAELVSCCKLKRQKRNNKINKLAQAGSVQPK